MCSHKGLVVYHIGTDIEEIAMANLQQTCRGVVSALVLEAALLFAIWSLSVCALAGVSFSRQGQ